METVQMIWAWIMANYMTVVDLVGAAVVLATLLAALTPSPKDDAIVGKVKEVFYKILDFFKLGRVKFIKEEEKK